MILFLNNLADYDLSNLFGNPEFEFSGSYTELDKFRKNFFDKYNITINTSQFIRANERIFSSNVVDTVKTMTPARSTMADSTIGIVIEPNILERTKIKNHKLSLQYGNVGINDLEDTIHLSTPTTGSIITINQSSIDFPKDALVDVSLLTTSSYQPTRNVTLASPVTSSAYYDSTKDTHIGSTLKTLLTYEETKEVFISSSIKTKGSFEDIKEVIIESPVSESFHYEPIRNIHLGSPISESMNYEAQKNILFNIEEQVVESATYEEVKSVHIGSSVSESMNYEAQRDYIIKYKRSSK